MKQIRKNKEPGSLIAHRKTAHANYDNYPEKDELRASLHHEQGGICCYCLGYIEPQSSEMKIEHFKCREDFPEHQLEYWNLLGACKGSEGQSGHLQHCDTYKGRKVLNFYPPQPNPNIEDLIHYSNNGSVYSNNTYLQQEIKEVLNLNVQFLVNNRKAALDGFKSGLSKYKGPLTKSTLKKWLADWSGTQGPYRPYCMVVAYWIQKKLNRA